MNPRAAGFIPSPGTPTIAFLVEKSRTRLHELHRTSASAICNYIIYGGFATLVAEKSSNFKREMPLMEHFRRLFPSLPRDYIRRRRALRRITDVS